MDEKLYQLYCELLSVKLPDGRVIWDRINKDDLCLTGHHKGRDYKEGLLIYGQAVNGWQNTAFNDTDTLIQEVLHNADDYRTLYPMMSILSEGITLLPPKARSVAGSGA